MRDMVVVTGGWDYRQNEVLSRMVVYNTTGEALFHGFNTADLSLNTGSIL